MGSNGDFFEDVFAVVRLIPSGRVSSYGAIARYLGAARSARMVGWAMNASHGKSDHVPAHRVLNRKGELTGRHHFEGPDRMEELLMKEGIFVENDCVKDFPKFFWDPMRELEL